VITIQPTSPLLSISTLNSSIKKLIDEWLDSLISLREETHLYRKEVNWKIIPDFIDRVNRQYLPKRYVETWAIIWCKAEYLLTYKTRINIHSCSFLITPEEESIDIDSYNDRNRVNTILTQKSIWINIIWNKKNGTWHIYRQLQIAFHLDIKPIFFVQSWNDLAVEKVRESHYEVIEFATYEELQKLITRSGIKILINDVLQTTKTDMSLLKETWVKLINFEDFGEGTELTDATINAMYELSTVHNNMYHGHQYIIVREDVISLKPRNIKDNVELITISCGWTDPNNLTCLYIASVAKTWWSGKLNIILWPWYDHHEKLTKTLALIDKNSVNYQILQDISNMGEIIHQSDLMLTSNGRTIYEESTLWVPTISLCQNQQEMTHTFGMISWSTINLWLVTLVDKEILIGNLFKIIADKELREKLHYKMLAHQFKNGIKKVLDIIYSI
jgi:spore coat polysaccharide biosynthesis predicted glycosyltransferase SpsG